MTMAEDWPKIVSRRTTTVSPWMEIIEREVEFSAGAEHRALSRGRPAGLHRHRRADAGRPHSDRAAIPAGAGALHLGIAGRPGR